MAVSNHHHVVSFLLIVLSDLDYVLQRVLSVVEADQKELLFTHVKVQIANMRKTPGPHNKHLNASTFFLVS
jgi:hypothetical protein